MKTQNLFFMLILISMAFSFISCTDEDDKVEIPQLVGKWIVKEPVLQDDFVTCSAIRLMQTRPMKFIPEARYLTESLFVELIS